MDQRRSRLAGFTIALALAELSTDTARAQAATQAGVPATTIVAVKVTPAVKTDSASSAAVAPAAPIPTFFTEIQANAFASFGYTYNTNKPTSRLNGFRVFDSDANTFGVDVAELVLQRAIAKPGETGFRMDLEVGSAIPQKSQASGLSVGQSADLQQAMLSYLAPVGKGLRLDFGKFVTPLGYELIEGYDGYNDNYSRSFLFNYAIPLTHTGVKASYPLTSAVSAMVMVVNGWDNARDNNSGKSIGGQLTLVPVAPVSIIMGYIGGPEKPDTNGSFRHTFDLVASWKALDILTLAVNGDYGVEKNSSLVTPGKDAVWKGIAGYAIWGPTNGFSLAFRGETFHDEGGTRLAAGSAATVSELTLTPSYKVGDHFLVRSDVRFDRANQPLFIKDANTATTTQRTLTFNAIFVY
jgi:hypothetical protein